MKNLIKYISMTLLIALLVSIMPMALAETAESGKLKAQRSSAVSLEKANGTSTEFLCVGTVWTLRRTDGPYSSRPSPYSIYYSGDSIKKAEGSFSIRSKKVGYKYYYYVDYVFKVNTSDTPYAEGYVGCFDVYDEPIYVMKIWTEPHREVVTIPAVAPTCQREGNTEGSRCANCSWYVFKESVKLPKLDHDWVIKETLQQPTPELPQIDLMECSMCHTEKQVTSKYPITDLKLAESNVSLWAHKDKKNPSTQQLTLTITPAEAATEEIVWTSSDTSVITVDSNGLASASNKAGTATVTATNPRTGKTVSCAFTVEKNTKAKLKKLTVDKKKVKLAKGETYKVKIGVKPVKVFNNMVTWKTSDKKIAKVSKDGTITAKKKGKCQITATSKLNKSKKVVITIIVK